MKTSPFVAQPMPLQTVMVKVITALVPGVLLAVWAFGIGVLVQIALAIVVALATEAACLKLRNYPLKPFLTDGSAVVTACLLALSIPPLAPWWLIVLGTFIAIGFAKHLYGGLGQNPFNPAMVGFAVLIVSFPAQMSRWAAPRALAQPDLGALAQVVYIFTGHLSQAFDAVASATPLDTIRTGLLQHGALRDILKAPLFHVGGGPAQQWISLGFLVGGLYLWRHKVINWRLPLAFIAGLGLTATVFWLADSAHYMSPLFHLVTGGAMLGAFFIITDPVTAPTTPLGQFIFAGLSGMLAYLIRVLGNYPDGVAFAVLILNIAGPFIDQYTQPAVFGRKKKGAKA
ncbi:MAG: RnfABCDGE type electron transport complex subunit D [Formivibrio sp.]|nr:RnfABCDGE type electron transport complex subunit D [Formivibrio sp.]